MSDQLMLVSTYFSLLAPGEKLRFLYRVQLLGRFIHFEAKPGIRLSIEMKLMILSAIVQLTFGLKRFIFAYYQKIILEPGLYRMPDYREKFLGHVDKRSRTVTLSWPYTRYGFAVNDDAHNVALHEMAHVILFENTLRLRTNSFFTYQDWEYWLSKAEPRFILNQKAKNILLSEYADKNLMEMFAVSVETFFEKPDEFKSELPELYNALVRLLRQDPTNQSDPRGIFTGR